MSTSQPPLPNQPNPSSDIPPFPSPQTFDILPQIHEIISRLPNASAATALATAGTTTTTTLLDPQSTVLNPTVASSFALSLTSSVPAIGAGGADITISPGGAAGTLDLRNLPQAMVAVKIKIQKARGVVSGLPDVERGIEEQEEEIGALQRRLGVLRGVIGELGQRAAPEREGREGEMDTRA